MGSYGPRTQAQAGPQDPRLRRQNCLMPHYQIHSAVALCYGIMIMKISIMCIVIAFLVLLVFFLLLRCLSLSLLYLSFWREPLDLSSFSLHLAFLDCTPTLLFTFLYLGVPAWHTIVISVLCCLCCSVPGQPLSFPPCGWPFTACFLGGNLSVWGIH